MQNNNALLTVTNLVKHFDISGGLLEQLTCPQVQCDGERQQRCASGLMHGRDRDLEDRRRTDDRPTLCYRKGHYAQEGLNAGEDDQELSEVLDGTGASVEPPGAPTNHDRQQDHHR